MTQKQHQILICLASNTDQRQHLEAARGQLALLLGELKYTAEHWTEPVNSVRKEPYLNQLCQGTTILEANQLNEALKDIEKRLGRTHNKEGIVTIDLDLMAYDNQRYHLRDWERDYVKNLLNEL